MSKTYFKIVRNVEGLYRVGYNSCVGAFRDDEFTVEYVQNKATVPKVAGSKLFLFETFQDAHSYLQKEMSDWPREFEIWEVSATEVSRPKYLSYCGENLREFYAAKSKKKKLDPQKFRLVAPPKGTLTASSITLLRKTDF